MNLLHRFLDGDLVGRQGFAPELVKLGAEHAETDGIDAVDPVLSRAPVAHQPGVLQHFQVLRDRWPADRKSVRQLADRARALSDALEDRASRGIGERSPAVLRVGLHRRVSYHLRILGSSRPS